MTTSRARPFVLAAACALAVVLLVAPATAHAQGTICLNTILPTANLLQSIAAFLSGPILRAAGAIGLVLGVFMWAFGRHDEGLKKVGMVLVAVTVGIVAGNIINALYAASPGGPLGC